MANESTPAGPLGSESPKPTPSALPAAPAPFAPANQKVSYFRFFRFSHLRNPGEVKVFQHSRIFYWWPIWFFGFLFAALSYFSGWQLAHVPEGTHVAEKNGHFEVELPEKAKLPTRYNAETKTHDLIQPIAHVTKYRGLGTLYFALLLMVIIFTTMAFRGVLSIYLVIVLVFLSIIFYLAGWWDVIFDRIGQLAVYISAGGYLIMATVMFILWIINLMILDNQTYIIFTPGQVRVKLDFGGGETIYSAKGLSLHKLKGDFFRHWVLGLGTGDIEIHVQGLARPLELVNVLNANQAIRAIESVVQEQQIITTSSTSLPEKKA